MGVAVVVVFIGLSACDPGDAVVPPDVADVPSSSSFAPDAPAWTADEAVAALDVALASGVPDPSALLAAYDVALAMRDADCPISRLGPDIDSEGFGPWYADGCATIDGIVFDGDAADFVSTMEENDGSVGYERALGGNGTVSDAEGVGYHHTGQVTLECAVSAAGDASWSASLSGTFGGAWMGGWFVPGGGASVFLDGERAVNGARTLSIAGGLAGEGAPVYLDALALSAEACGWGLSGVVRVQDPTGWWWRLALEGGCDVCGALSWEGTDHGEACLGDGLVTSLASLTEDTCTSW